MINPKEWQRNLWLPWKPRPESRLCVRGGTGVGQKTSGLSWARHYLWMNYRKSTKTCMDGKIIMQIGLHSCLISLWSFSPADNKVRKGWPHSQKAVEAIEPAGRWEKASHPQAVQSLGLLACRESSWPPRPCTWAGKSPPSLVYLGNVLQVISMQRSFSRFIVLAVLSVAEGVETFHFLVTFNTKMYKESPLWLEEEKKSANVVNSVDFC